LLFSFSDGGKHGDSRNDEEKSEKKDQRTFSDKICPRSGESAFK